MNHSYFLLLQISDPLFPIGGYTQSYGLETYVQNGLVDSGETAELLLKAQLETSFLYSELLAVKTAFSYGTSCDLEKLVELEQLSRASRTSKELREACHKLGNRFVRTVEGFPLEGSVSLEFFHEYKNACKGVSLSYPIAFGVFCSQLDLELDQILGHFLYSQASSFLTNCVKLVPLSQTEGQKILCRVEKEFPPILKKLETLEEKDLFLSCVGLELSSMEHERLYSRLYMS